RFLDFRAGTLGRRAEWLSPAGRRVRVSSTRLVSFAQRAVAAILYEVEPLESRLRLVIQSELVANEPTPAPSKDPRAAAALTSPRHGGWEGLLQSQRAYLDDFWHRADVELSGDEELQQAVRFALFHVLQSAARAEQRAIPAKGLTGPGYDGHVFWDTEMFVLPVLTYTVPAAAADALRWRQATLPLARERAELLGLTGAAFPWRTIRGHECSGYWPAGTAAFHINADIASAVVRYVAATEDQEFEREVGL